MTSPFAPNTTPDVTERLKRIKVLLMDVDGVLTDGRLFYLPGADGKMVEFKSFNSQDGLGFFMLNQFGIKTGVISGRESPAVVERGRILKFSYIYQGHLEKTKSWMEVLEKAGVTDDEVAYIGDDFPDVPLMRRAGVACAVGNARPELKAIAHIVTKAYGGEGAAREVIELILKAQGKWAEALARFELLATQQSEPVPVA